MKNTLLKIFALIFSSSLVVLFILYQTGSFEPVEVYNLSYPKQSENKDDSSLSVQTTNKSKFQAKKNHTTPAIPTNIELPKEENVVIQFDGKILETKEQKRIRMMSSKSLIFPRKKTELDKYFEFVKVYDSLNLSTVASNRLFLLDSEVTFEFNTPQRLMSTKSSVVKFKPLKPKKK